MSKSRDDKRAKERREKFNKSEVEEKIQAMQKKEDENKVDKKSNQEELYIQLKDLELQLEIAEEENDYTRREEILKEMKTTKKELAESIKTRINENREKVAKQEAKKLNKINQDKLYIQLKDLELQLEIAEEEKDYAGREAILKEMTRTKRNIEKSNKTS